MNKENIKRKATKANGAYMYVKKHFAKKKPSQPVSHFSQPMLGASWLASGGCEKKNGGRK
jgi:hypothetical protein